MPTSSVAGFVLRSGTGGGAEAPLGDSQLPWRAAVGKSVRLVCFALVPAGAEASPDSVEGWEKWPLLTSPHVAQYIRLVFALSSEKFRFFFACSGAEVSRLESPAPAARSGGCQSRYTE